MDYFAVLSGQFDVGEIVCSPTRVVCYGRSRQQTPIAAMHASANQDDPCFDLVFIFIVYSLGTRHRLIKEPADRNHSCGPPVWFIVLQPWL